MCGQRLFVHEGIHGHVIVLALGSARNTTVAQSKTAPVRESFRIGSMMAV